MQLWQIALIVLVGAWGLQALGTLLQMRHCQGAMGTLSRRWSDGYLGAGNARGNFGRGVILVLVVAPDQIVRRILVMEGRSVLATFKALKEFEGRALDELRSGRAFGEAQKGREKALLQAIEQIDRARAAKQNAALATPQPGAA